MVKFCDEAFITVSSGKGGDGAVSFRREKNVPMGGPDGGDGGKGGDVFFYTKENLKTLTHIKPKEYRAEDGQKGAKSNMTGRNGQDILIEIPPGTLIKDLKGNVILDALEANKKYFFLKGGDGGRGNAKFKSSVNQVPYDFEAGFKNQSLEVKLELNLIADIGLVGFPNAGKSSLLVSLTNAKSEIAPYPFTTKIPHLGVLKIDYERSIILADIPGLLEGASDGVGLGDKFLKHILRTKVLAFLVDLNDDNPKDTFETLKLELFTFSDKFKEKPIIVIGTKFDLVESSKENEFLEIFSNYKTTVISSYTKYNTKELIKEFLNITYEKSVT